jgi:UDP-GlcNAc:undecaprenyl-phosphate GlcNAc-1-phosphate transferase
VKEYLLTLLVTAAVTYMLTPLVRRLAVKVGAVKQVRDRDVHVIPIPEFGGLAMFAGLAAGLLVAGQLKPLDSVFSGSSTLSTETGLLLAGGLIVVIGVIDDRWGLNPISKLAGQVTAGVILVASGCEIGWVPLPGSNVFSPSPNQDIVLTILIVVATINAVNFIDGLDGLAAGIVAIAAVSFFLYYYSLTKELGLSTEAGPALVSALVIGMCLGFLPHNFYPARIFMGDTGAMLLGLLLAYAPISSTSSLDPQVLISGHAYHIGAVNRFPEILPLLLPGAILVIPYADMLMAVFRRTRAGKSPFAADRKHLHHRLLDIGHSHRSSVIIMYLWAALFSTAVVTLSILGRPSWVFGAITVGAVLLLLLMSMPRLRWWGRQQRVATPAVPAGSVAPASPATGAAAEPAAPGVLVPAAARLSGVSGNGRSSSPPWENGRSGDSGSASSNGLANGLSSGLSNGGADHGARGLDESRGHRRLEDHAVPLAAPVRRTDRPDWPGPGPGSSGNGVAPPTRQSATDFPGSPGQDLPIPERSRTTPAPGAGGRAAPRDDVWGRPPAGSEVTEGWERSAPGLDVTEGRPRSAGARDTTEQRARSVGARDVEGPASPASRPRSVVGFVPPAVDDDPLPSPASSAWPSPPVPADQAADQPSDDPPRPPSPPRTTGSHRRPSS